MQPLAVITMVYNEADKLPYWLAHYGAEVGCAHCYVVDHGSSDGSTTDLRGASRIALPRSAQDNDRRTAFIGNLAASLLRYYWRVVYVDADELLVADPARYATLADYAAQSTTDATTAIGIEIVHAPGDEPLDGRRGVGEQRSYGLFSSSMCKTSLIGRPVTWAPGFHSHDGAPRFDDLYLFHLRHADLGQALHRLATTRAMAWVHATAGEHQRGDDNAMIDLVRRFGGRPLAGSGIAAGDAGIAGHLASFAAGALPGASPDLPWSVPLAIYGEQRLTIEPRFIASLSRRPGS